MSLMHGWNMVAEAFPGWTLEDIKGLSRRERTNWLEMHYRKPRGGS